MPNSVKMFKGGKIYEFAVNLFKNDSVPTESFSFGLLKKNPIHGVNYLAVPWADLINKNDLGKVPLNHIDGGFTICQHVDYKKIIPILKKIGIDVLFAPHVDENVKGLKVLPFPHYACKFIKPASKKDILYSFIGYDSTSKGLRSTIFNMSHPKDVIVKQRPSWHWSNERDWAERISLKAQKREGIEYQNVLSRSRFSLCPRGWGASTIRFWESLGAGAIPVLISDNMMLPKMRSVNWEKCIVRIAEKDVHLIPQILGEISARKELKMRKNCIKAYNLFSGENFVGSIREFYDANLFSKLMAIVEKRRGLNNLLWRLLVLGKDICWRISIEFFRA